MRKNILLLMLVTVLFALTGCGNKGKVKVYENTEEIIISHIEKTATMVVTDMNLDENIISFTDCASGEELKLGYHGGVSITNSYGTEIGVDDIQNGSVVDVVYYSDTEKLVSMAISQSVTTLKGVSKFIADVENNKAMCKGKSYTMSENIVAYDGETLVDVMEISTEDQVTLNIYNDKLVSVIIEIGHGYVRLDNQYTYIGGMVEIGYDVIVPVTDDMLIAVREGEYTLRINKNGYSNTKTVVVKKGEETYVDIANIAIPTGMAVFNVTPSGAKIYVEGKPIDGYTYTAVYGSYSIKVEADNYKTFRGSFKIDEGVNTYDITLVPIEDAEEEDDSDSTTESGGSSENTTAGGGDDSENITEGNTESSTTQTGESTENIIKVNGPTGVGVYVDGEYVGIAPISFPKTVGSHTITLYQSGYIIKSYTIYASNNGKDDEYTFDALIPILDITAE